MKRHGDEVKCPSCGAPLAERIRGPEMVVCSYCRAYVALTGGVATVAGTSVELVKTPTRFRIGQRLRVRGSGCEIVGRARYQYEDGFWDEWQLAIGAAGSDQVARLSEDEGDLVVWARESAGPPADLARARPGAAFPVAGRSIVIAEIGEAKLVGAEGTLPRQVSPKESFEYVDGHSAGEVVSLRVWKERSLLLSGWPVRHEEIEEEA